MHCIHYFNCMFSTFLCANLCAHFITRNRMRLGEKFSIKTFALKLSPNIYVCVRTKGNGDGVMIDKRL